MSETTQRKIVKPWQALLMIVVGIAIIFLGLMVFKAKNHVILLTDGVVMCVMACCFGIKYDDLQADIKATINSMLVAILILIAVGVLTIGLLISAGVFGAPLRTAGVVDILLDTGTGLAPLVPWATTGAYVASTLGVDNMSLAPFAPMLWLSIVISVVMGLTGIGMVKLKDQKAAR